MNSGNASAGRRRALLSGTALVALSLALAPSPSRAADVNWTGANSANWLDPGNWSTGVPAADNAIIDTTTPNPTEVDGGAAQAQDVYVGRTGTGMLTIRNGGTVNNTGSGALGVFTGSTGTATVDGAGSSWSNGSLLIVGNQGIGTLTIQNGGAVSNVYSGFIGYFNGSRGTVTVDGAGSSWANAQDLNIGQQFGSTGTLTIQNGGVVSNVIGYVGNQPGSTGTVTVDGAGSSWTNSSELYVGNSGTGTLTIRNGGAVNNTGGYIGYFAGSTGTVTVDGAGSSWTSTSALYVGNFGSGALTIQSGGAVSNIGGYIGGAGGSTGIVTVDGAGSSWTNTSDLLVGYRGTGTLTIRNDGAVSSTVGYVGTDAGSTGTVTVDGTNSSWTSAGNLYVGNFGSGALTIQNGGAVSNTTGYVGHDLGSTGTVTVDGTGSTWTNTDGLMIGRTGTGTLNIQNGGAVSYATVGYIGYTNGSTGTVTVDGTGSSLTTPGNITVGGFGAGTLTITNGGAVANDYAIVGYNPFATGTVTVDGAASSWTNTNELAVGYSGTGTLTIRNGGTVSAPNAVIANDVGSIGTLNIGAASGQVAVAPGTLNTPTVAFGAGTGQIVFNHTSANYAFNPAISGAGSVSVEAGTTDLAATNTYTGATTVNGGTLSVNGSIASSVLTTVNAGGTLGGTGTVGATTIASGGSLAPGNSIGTLTVQGNLTFNAGGVYTVEVSPTAADRTNVVGTATLTGATVNAVALPGSFRAQTYTILNATGGFGGTQFAALTGSTFAPGARNPHLTYDANNVFLVLDPGTIQLPAGTGGNQSSAAGAINNAVVNGGTPPAAFDALLNMTGGQLSNALGQVSGQPGASTVQSGFAGVGQFANAIFDGAFGDDGGQGGAIGFAQTDSDMASAYAAKKTTKVAREAADAFAKAMPVKAAAASFDARWNVWASVYGGNSRVNGDTGAGTNMTTSRIFGAAVGATYRFTPETQAGFALGGAGSNFDIANGFGGGKADVFNAAVYAKHTMGAAYVAGLLGYSWQDTSTDRTVTIAGTDRLHASFKAQALAARLEGGWRYAAPMVGITPYGALQSTTFYLPSYGETVISGSGAFALSYASKATTATRGELGAKFDKAMLVQNGVFTLKAKTAWAHDWNTDRAATATFQALPGATFTTNGAQPSANAALLSLGGEMKWHNGWTLAGSFDGEFSRTTASYAGKGSVRYAW